MFNMTYEHNTNYYNLGLGLSEFESYMNQSTWKQYDKKCVISNSVYILILILILKVSGYKNVKVM